MARSFIETKNFIFSESRNRKFRTLVLTTLVVNNEILIRYANLELVACLRKQARMKCCLRQRAGNLFTNYISS